MQPISPSMLNTPETMEPFLTSYKLKISTKTPVNTLFAKLPSGSHNGLNHCGIAGAESAGTGEEEDIAATGVITLSGPRPTQLKLHSVLMLIIISKLRKFSKQEKPNQETGEKSPVLKVNMSAKSELDLDPNMILILALLDYKLNVKA